MTVLFNFQFQAFDFRTTTRNEPFLQLFHCLYVYPTTVSLSRKRNLFIRVELREDDNDIRRQPLEVNMPIILCKNFTFLNSFLTCLVCGAIDLTRQCIHGSQVHHFRSGLTHN